MRFPSAMTDTHAHLNHRDFARDLAAVVERARASGVQRMIVVGYDLPSSRQAVALAERENGVFAAVGVHPHDAGACSPDAFAELRELACSPRVIGIGETGLDYYRNLSSKEAQQASLHAHLELAAEIGLPVILHNREAQADLLRLLAEASRQTKAGRVWHCFSGDAEDAQRALDLGLFLGLGGPVTFENAKHLREVVAELPLDRILLETDCPYLSPHPHRGQRNEPARLPLIAEELARLRRIPLSELIAQIEKNVETAFPRMKEAS